MNAKNISWSDANIFSLKGRKYPKNINYFNVSKNFLSDLVGGPNKIIGNYYAHDNRIGTLEGAPSSCLYFDGRNNLLRSLKFCPEAKKYDFYNNRLHSIEGIPDTEVSVLILSKNFIKSIEFLPQKIQQLYLDDNWIASLKGIHTHFKNGNISTLDLRHNPFRSHLLGLILIPGIQEISLDETALQDIFDKHLLSGRDVLECQEELIQNGFKEFAQL